MEILLKIVIADPEGLYENLFCCYSEGPPATRNLAVR